MDEQQPKNNGAKPRPMLTIVRDKNKSAQNSDTSSSAKNEKNPQNSPFLKMMERFANALDEEIEIIKNF